MEGGGFYNQHSHLQFQSILEGLPLLERAAREVCLPDGPCLIADYGSSQGSNSMVPMALAIDTLKGRRDIPVSVVHTDLPCNDFNALFAQCAESTGSYLCNRTEVYSYATGKSFYGQLFPEATVCLGWSSIAVHWLSRVPCILPGHIWTSRAQGDLRKKFAQVAQEDWAAFLLHRAKEIRPGGALVLVGRVSDEKGNTGAEGLIDMADEAFRELVSEGLIHQGEYDRMLIPTYYRTIEEYRAPFDHEPVAAVLKIEECSYSVLHDPLYDTYLHEGDARSFAEAYVTFFEAYSNASFIHSLDPERSAGEIDALRASLYDRLRDKISCSPGAAVCPWNIILMRITRLMA